MVNARRSFLGIVCTLLMAAIAIAGCAAKQGWNRPLFSAGNCGLAAPLSSVVFEARAAEVSFALRSELRGRGWIPLQEGAEALEATYKRAVTEPAATAGLGPHYQYLLVIVTSVKEQVSRVSFVLSEFDPGSDLGTSFALVTPEDFIDGYAELVRSVRESIQGGPHRN